MSLRIGARTAVVAASALVSVALMAAPSWAEEGGNSANAGKCKNGGWQTLNRSDGTTFKNQGQCVTYAAEGGTFGKANLTLSPGKFTGTAGESNTYIYDFGVTTSAKQTFTVTNSGTGRSTELKVVGELIGGNVSNDTCTGNTLAPNATCTFEVVGTAPATCTPVGNPWLRLTVLIEGTPVGVYDFLNVQALCPG